MESPPLYIGHVQSQFKQSTLTEQTMEVNKIGTYCIKKLSLRPQKVDFLFLRHFFEKTNARGRNFFFIVSDFFFLFLSR